MTAIDLIGKLEGLGYSLYLEEEKLNTGIPIGTASEGG